MTQTFRETIKLIQADMQMRCEYEHKKLGFLRILRFVLYSASSSVILARLQFFFYHNHMQWIAGILAFINKLFFTVSIDSSAIIGPGLMFLHASYITIGRDVEIGAHCILVHQNTIMPDQIYNSDDSEFGSPKIGNHLFMGVGSVITGDIKLGNHVQISANAVVDKCYPDHAVLFGVPAKNLAKKITEATHHA